MKEGADPSPPFGEGPPGIDLAELLSTCVDACRRGCEVIRNVRHRSLHCLDVLDSIHYKIADDPRSALTEADGASQKVIIECLNCCWAREIESGRIKIVGEEEDDHSTDLEGEKSYESVYSDNVFTHFDNYNCPRTDHEPIIRDMFRSSDVGRSTRLERGEDDSGCDEIIIFIDPMDGTREFVEGRIQNVQCLIGITFNGMPVAGAMGMPMVHETKIEIAYGLIALEKNESKSLNPVPLLSGIKFFDALNPLEKDPPDLSASGDVDSGDGDDNYSGTLVVFSGDSIKPSLSIAMDCLENNVLGGSEELIDQEGETIEVQLNPLIRKVIVGGCGHKILSVQRHVQSLVRQQRGGCEGSASSQPVVGAISLAPPGSSSWDTAAPTAVLLAADPKARVTDLLGRPLIYDGDNLSNKCGVVASSGSVASIIHERLCMGLSNDGALYELISVNLCDKAPPNAQRLDKDLPPVELIIRSISELDLVRSISELNS
jgi:3'-phosphoadenosine 5'-phosphosulfate (PAPS) 3'-phosphatase